MGLYLYLDERYLADVATNSGWIAFAKWGRRVKNSPRLKELCEEGCTQHGAELLIELRGVSKPKNADVAEVLAGIVDALVGKRLRDKVVIVSDGLGD